MKASLRHFAYMLLALSVTSGAVTPAAAQTPGISKADGAGLGVAVGDYNNDGWLDLYYTNSSYQHWPPHRLCVP